MYACDELPTILSAQKPAQKGSNHFIAQQQVASKILLVRVSR